MFAFGLLLAGSAQAASLYISPASGSFSLGSNFSVTVRTDTQGQAVNTAEATISYSSNLELVSVAQGGTFYLASPGSPAKGQGSAYFGGGLPSPGYTGGAGHVGTLTFRGTSVGSATITVGSGKALLNDGQGTNALAATAGGRYTITPPAVAAPEVGSPTHPKEEAWYAKNEVELIWTRPANAYGFSFELDQKEDTVPDNTLDTTVTTSQKYPDLEDGVWYFHIKARRQEANSAFGPTEHFRIQIDTEVPKLFKIQLVGQADLNDVTRTPTIEFEATDPGGSGIEHYEIFLDEEEVAERGASPHTFHKMKNGPHVIRVTAVDRAGNERQSELPIIVNGLPLVGFFANLQLPLYLLFALNLLLLLLIGWLIRELQKLKKEPGVKEILALRAEVDFTLNKLRHRIHKKLGGLAADKPSVEIVDGIEATRRHLDRKIVATGESLSKKLKT
ncbi:MAG: hypothetical protein HY398_01805 [Candidatus Doudnabacteria bacterium]|nr:hypothetical protein [Candidatus Doudnabacteria bacterium]